jgi:hypothetical protein
VANKVTTTPLAPSPSVNTLAIRSPRPGHAWAEWATLSVGASQVASNPRSESPGVIRI